MSLDSDRGICARNGHVDGKDGTSRPAAGKPLVPAAALARRNRVVGLWRWGALLRQVAAIVGLSVVAAGCGGKMQPVHYYHINYPPSVSPGTDPLNVSIAVRGFFSSHLYREDRIVYGSGEFKMGTYQNERWDEPPTEMLQSAIVRGLRASGRFRNVTSMRSDVNSDFLLTGRLYDFQELSSNGLQARLNYDVELRDLKAAKLVWTHTYRHDEPADGKEVASMVAAMDRNVRRSVHELEAGLEEYFTKRTSN